MPDVYLYTTRFCPYCIEAKQLLSAKGVNYREIPVDGNPELRMEMMAASGRRTVPQIWIGGNHIGGCDDLFVLERSGELDVMLAQIRQ
jgi:glutaredoxin 3